MNSFYLVGYAIVPRVILTTVVSLFTFVSTAQDILISDEGTLTTCTGTIYDSGGPEVNYQNDEEYTLTICTDEADACFQLEFLSFNVEAGYDFLRIYEGEVAQGDPLVELSGDIDPDNILIATSCVTLVFTTDGSVTRPGFEIAISCTCSSCDDGIQNGEELAVDCGGPDCEPCNEIIMGVTTGTVYTCSNTIFDNGGFDDYNNNRNDTITVCGENPGDCLQAAFLLFEVESITWDRLDVYAGEDMDAPLFGSYGGGAPPPDVINPGSECLTFHFVSDGSVTFAGFEIAISCVCPTCDDEILNGDELGIDCGGANCPACDFLTIDEGGTVNTCAETLFDSGGASNYGVNEQYSMTICAESPSQCMELFFPSIDIEEGDHLYIYDGAGTDGLLIADLSNTQFQTSIGTTSNCLTFEFVSDGQGTAAGFEVEISCADACPSCTDGILNGSEVAIDCGGPDCESCPFLVMGQQMNMVTTCSATLYDNGYTDDYLNNSNDVLTICAESSDDCLQAAFVMFDINSTTNDWLYIYAGIDTDAPLIGGFNQGNPPPAIIDAGTECLTFQLISNGSFTSDGFEIEISCECPSCDDGILNGQEVLIDCGGPDCPPCAFNTISEEITVTTCQGTLFDSGLSGNYGPNEDYTMTYCAESPEECLKLDFLSLGIAVGDHLYVYDGEGTDGELLADITTAVSYADINTPSSCATFQFVSNSVGAGTGFEIDINCECVPSSLEENGLVRRQLKVSPNPSDGVIRLETTISAITELRIISDDGRILRREFLKVGADPQVDISTLPNGHYQVLLISEGSFAVASVLKQ